MPSPNSDSFQCGPFEVVRRPDASVLVDKLNRLREAVDANRLQPGVGYTVSRAPGGTVLSIKTGGGSVEAPETHPWQVSIVTRGRQRHFRVAQGSVIDGVTVSNLAALVPIPSNSPGPFHCVLRIPVSANLQASDASIVALAGNELPLSVIPANGRQTESNKVLATLQTDGVLIQAVRRNLLFVFANNGGFAAKMAVEQ